MMCIDSLGVMICNNLICLSCNLASIKIYSDWIEKSDQICIL